MEQEAEVEEPAEEVVSPEPTYRLSPLGSPHPQAHNAHTHAHTHTHRTHTHT